MTELEKIKPSKVTLKLNGKEREIKFGFSAWAKIEQEYDGLKNLEKMQEDIENKPFTVIPHLLWLGIADKEGLSEETLLDEFTMADIQMITEKFSEALYGSLPKDDEEKKTKKAVKKN